MTRRLSVLFMVAFATPCLAADPEPRPAEQVVQELLQVYGKSLPSVTYIPALAVHQRSRVAVLTGDASQRRFVESLLGDARPVPKSNVEYAGHLVFAGVARDPDSGLGEKSIAAVRRAADQLLNPNREVRLPGSQEMSDAVFMCGPILCEAGSLTGEAVYFDAAVKYLSEMRRLRLRDDGLYRHGHLCDAAWGRGNGFPAVGVAWSLSCLPAAHPGRRELMESYRRHMQALAAHQTQSGCWRQVIDVPDGYEEFSATAMIGFAMQRGIASGWLDKETYQPKVDRAWDAVCRRIHPDGRVIDVCEGTGTQKTLEDYLKRKALRGVDDRGGAMALLFAVERLQAKPQDR